MPFDDTNPRQVSISNVPLLQFANQPRGVAIDVKEAYFRSMQDAWKSYNWDGDYVKGMQGQRLATENTTYVPYMNRIPSVRYDIGKVIVKRLTAMLFGTGHFPEIKIHGDPDAEDYVKALAKAARLSQRMLEARDLGGACGSVCLSMGLLNGKPRVNVHNAKHCTVLRWAERDELRVGAALLTYEYEELVSEAGKVDKKKFYYARYWDEEREIIWSPIPQEVAESPLWTNWQSETIEHGLGFTPFYWIQNEPDNEEDDGNCDYEGMPDLFDELNRLLSAGTRGVRANVDPTLVVMDDPVNNPGTIRAGSGNSLYSPGGAKYLELSGTAQKAQEMQAKLIIQMILDTAGVVMADPQTISGSAQSAAAMRLIYAPMLAKVDVLREQYGEQGLRVILVDMLRMAKMVESQPPVEEVQPDGTVKLVKSRIILPPRVDMIEEDAEDEEAEEETALPGMPPPIPKRKKKEVSYEITERVPGELEEVELVWAPYFSPTWTDIAAAVNAVKGATNNKPVLSQKSGVSVLAPLFEVSDATKEMEEIERDEEMNVQMAERIAFPGPGEDLMAGAPKGGTKGAMEAPGESDE